MAKVKVDERLAAIESERARLESERVEVRLAALDAEAAAIRDAAAAEVDTERLVRLAAARERREVAELAYVAGVLELVRLGDELAATEREVYGELLERERGEAVSVRVPAFVRQAVRRCMAWWRNWYPELIGEAPRHEHVIEPLDEARERVRQCEAMLRELGDESSGVERWRESLKRARLRVAELGGEPYREPGNGRSVRQWLGLTGGDE